MTYCAKMLSIATEKDRDRHCATWNTQKLIKISKLPLVTYVEWIAIVAVDAKMTLDLSLFYCQEIEIWRTILESDPIAENWELESTCQ